MALIKCPECGKEVSDKAVACVNCGYPIREMTLDSHEGRVPNIDENEVQLEKSALNQGKKKEEESTIDLLKEYLNDIRKCKGSLSDFFKSLFYAVSLEYETTGETDYDFALAYFAALDIILSNKHGYDKYASRDWLEKNDDYCKERLKVGYSPNFVSYYEGFRYQKIQYHDEGDDLTGFPSYAHDVYYYSKSWLFENETEYSHKLNASQVETLKISELLLGIQIGKIVDAFSAVDLTDDYKREKMPVLADYDLPENIESIVNEAYKSQYNKQKYMPMVIGFGIDAILAAIAVYGNNINNNVILGIAMFLLCSFGFMTLFTPFIKVRDVEVISSLKQNNDLCRRYYEYEDKLARYTRKYSL